MPLDSKRKSTNPTHYPRQRQRDIVTDEPSSPADLSLSYSTPPSAYSDFLTIPNPLASSNLRHSSTLSSISEATSSIHPGTVNVVGRDQVNNVTNYIQIIPDLRAEENVDHFESGIRRNAEKLLLDPLFNKLLHVAEASFDASTPSLRRACTENTRTVILEAIRDWSMDSTQPKIYWMNGMAGTGKTTIAYSLSLILTKLNILGATFFCSRLVDDCTKVERIFPTIAYNLARTYPSLASSTLEVLKNDPDAAKRNLNQQFTELLVKPARFAAENLAGKPIVVIIDALDECSNQTHVQSLLSILFQRSSELSFKIFITSRPEQVIRVGFNRQNTDSYSRFILHDIDPNLVNADIKLYLAERLVEIVDGRSDFQESEDDWPPEEKLDILTRKANGLFIFAKTVCNYIGEPGGNILAHLDIASRSRDSVGTPSDTFDTSELDRLYTDILDRAIPSRPKVRDNLRHILSAIVNIRNPLSSRGLGALLEMDPGVIKSALGSLHAVISVPRSLEEPVSTFHASFPDYLSEPTRSLQHYIPPSKSHEMLVKSCLSLMNSSLKENICNLRGRPANDIIVNETISAHVPEGLSYACVYWASHLTRTGREEIQNAVEVHQLLNIFLRDHVLHWMECLSLLRQLHVAVESLRVIEGWVLNVYPELLATVTDSRRFIVENFEVINDYCLETYYSALVWLPIRSIIRKHHTSQKPELPKVSLGRRKIWGCCERTMICGSVVNSVALSNDGRRIVSGLFDFTVRIWSAATGKLASVLEGHSNSVLSVAFSSDGSHVASGSCDSTVRTWDAVTGKEERIFKGHYDRVTSVAFSSDRHHIVSGSYDKTVRIWDAATGEPESVLEGHSSSVLSVAFSTDGRYVVSGSADNTVRIWSAVTSEEESVLEGHLGWVSSVAFSSDGRVLVSGSYDMTIRIWNALTGCLESVLEGQSGSVLSVAFSSDGSHIVSGLYDGTVQMWKAVTGELQDVLEGHSGGVSSVALSSDGSLVVSGSVDKTIRIWDVANSEDFGLLGRHSGGVTSVALSNDGHLVVSGSYDKTVRVWNVVTGKPAGIFKGHRHSVRSVAFSNDGSHVVSGSYDTIRIWNTATGVLDYVLDGDSTAACDRPSFHALASCSLSEDFSWIRADFHQRSCWIPERYRVFSCTHACGFKMAFGYGSGDVVVVDLG